VKKDKEEKAILFKLEKTKPKNWVTLSQISKYAIVAVILSEDSNFFQHKGYDIEAIRAAIKYNLRPTTKIKRGASTITQQVVKNIFLTHEKTITRKIRELLLAIELERKLSKRKILEIYLNIVEWGNGIYGIENASLKYFSKHAKDLNPKEAAILAFMLPNPVKYQFSFQRNGSLTTFAKERIEDILKKMLKTKTISEEEFDTFIKSF
jgi:monofunctional biosynthetic peptidoglycan transglycosylase